MKANQSIETYISTLILFRMVTVVYWAFTTLATVGYGDYRP